MFDFPEDLDWINSPPLSFAQELKGKLVVFDFWTFCCINCIHVLPGLARLEEKYRNQPVVFVGVHSPKFPNERETEQIRQAVLRYEITHPVVNDPQMILWRALGVASWPTLAIFGPDATLLHRVSGEGHEEEIDAILEAALRRYAGQLDPKPIPQIPAQKEKEPSVLLFPGKVAMDSTGQRLFISDSNRNRLIVASPRGEVLDVIGSDTIGMVDGRFTEACFYRPQGITYSDEKLYVADTENHALRVVDLQDKRVTTLAGTGSQGHDYVGGGKGRKQPLSSPWDVVVQGDRLFIAMAGTHQIWTHDLKSTRSQVFSGSGHELLLDSDRLLKAAWAQPSGLALGDGKLFVADSESSSIRAIDLAKETTQTLVGGDPDNPRNLFAFGNRDGRGETARLQHPLGLVYLPQHKALIIADSYNHSLKWLDLQSREIVSWIDGHQFAEPAGLTVSPKGDVLFVADTNHHAIQSVDIATKEVVRIL